MKALRADFLQEPPRHRRTVLILTLLAIACSLQVAHRYLALREQISAMEMILTASEPAPRSSPPSERSLDANEYASARETAKRLATPWNMLFEALEAAQTERVALLAIEPDSERRAVIISGEARDYLAALSYVGGLAEQPSLRRVHLTRHEMKQGQSLTPMAFTISASWQDLP